MNLWWLIAVWPDVAWDAQLVRFSCSTTLVVFIYGRLCPYYSFIHPIDTLAAGWTGVPEKRDLAQTSACCSGGLTIGATRLTETKLPLHPIKASAAPAQPHTHVIESRKEMRLSLTIDALVSNQLYVVPCRPESFAAGHSLYDLLNVAPSHPSSARAINRFPRNIPCTMTPCRDDDVPNKQITKRPTEVWAGNSGRARVNRIITKINKPQPKSHQ